MQPQQPATPAAQPGAAGGMPQSLTPDQVRKMQIATKQAMSFLLQDQTAQAIVQKAKQGNPQEVVADVVVSVLGKVHQAASAAGQMGEGPEDTVTMLVAGVQIIGDLAEMLAAGGVLPNDPQALAQFVAQTANIAVQKHNEQMQQQGTGQPPQQGAAPAQPQGGV